MDNNRTLEVITQKLINGYPELADTIIKPYHWAREDFIKEEGHYLNQTIALSKITGTMHQSYAGETWGYLLKNGIRMTGNLGLYQANPEYYTCDAPKLPMMSFMRKSDEYYVYHDGNHRSCIGKFFLLPEGIDRLGTVTVYEHIEDTVIADFFNELEEVLKTRGKHHIHIFPHRKLIERLDGDGWKRDMYQTGIRLLNPKNRIERILDKITVQIYLDTLKNSGMFSWLKWPRNEFYQFF